MTTASLMSPYDNGNHTHRVSRSQVRGKKPTVRDWRSLTGAVIERRNVAQTWAAAWYLVSCYGEFQPFLWSDIAEVAKTLPDAKLDRLATFRLQMDAQHLARKGGSE